jgi:hypothetical protein
MIFDHARIPVDDFLSCEDTSSAEVFCRDNEISLDFRFTCPS